jgi:6-phosphogluconate dehydrogenase
MASPESSMLPTSVGVVGLGAMGKPMVINLAKRLPAGTRIHVHDVVPVAVDELFASFPETVVKCTSAKDVAEKSVRMHPWCFYSPLLSTFETALSFFLWL